MKLVGATDWFIMWPFYDRGNDFGLHGVFYIGSIALCRLSGVHRQTRTGSALSSGNCRGGACRKALCQSCYTWCVNGVLAGGVFTKNTWNLN